jgi:hypothetical protein
MPKGKKLKLIKSPCPGQRLLPGKITHKILTSKEASGVWLPGNECWDMEYEQGISYAEMAENMLEKKEKMLLKKLLK